MTRSVVNNPRLRDVPRNVRRFGIDACYSWRELVGYLRPVYGFRGGNRQATRMLVSLHKQEPAP